MQSSLLGFFPQNSPTNSIWKGGIVRKFRVAFLILFLTLITAGVAGATTLTFEDIGVPDASSPLFNTGFVNQGFMFNDATVLDISSGSQWSGSGPAYSGNYAVMNGWGGPFTITKVGGGTFSFQDTYIRSYFNYFIGSETSITGYLNGFEVGQVTFTMRNSWQNIEANFANIDQLVVGGWNMYVLADNMTFNGTTPVPEPSTMLLLGFGLAGLAAFRKKFRTT